MRTYKEVLEDGIQLLETAAIEEALSLIHI